MSVIARHFSVIGGGSQPEGVRLAFATSDGEAVDQHFGSATGFAIYEVLPESAQMVSMAQFAPVEPQDEQDKVSARLELLRGCIAVYCRACGASAVKQLLQRNIQPVKVIDDAAIKQLLRDFQKELAEGPSAWLARAIERQRRMQLQGLTDEYESLRD